ncbi:MULTISPECIES: M23 family metallopeptidase [Chryseobacterium]|uniref:Murein DD-endopeptidase MepM/ murein hydrolase activator NlpD n=1 Tax=Chryseobacterium camelliae TaxID=1265445 RepID=A0ABU0TFG3_9FLAO|nr:MULTISPECIES: M23 family metallopeptidase [Chryseobacterium]MDT3407194.1 murein DD-endopeptidase MepM/ murein hydrolase activator NlpD [Pseudacidovorax intermedius]MDQ1095015.1 murein DD-endopeptidase MepM/ murein hydrolase activator NlpD [Chryseobacterium camelliae]MDQ1098955.1 murein DD-endopeptidase MepM/ murein hydrolase activator NlpD [Chryseobacterium sp. SORGH_AS_1048]MDR6086303.1 murein DD-endopeptidase MepM/ murein hydrolase activator NlpD [Chryseobacterium sp. SORGH_AS_0909]MDR613
MKRFLNNKKKVNVLIAVLLLIVFVQGIFIAKLFSEKDNKNYEVNLVKINTEKDSVDYLKMKTDLSLIDRTVAQLNSFLKSKSIPNENLIVLNHDSISNSVYLARQSNRYSQYLMDLQQKLMQVPLGMPADGYISSNFGIRKNPIPFKTVYASVRSDVAPAAKPATAEVKAEPVEKTVELTDSYGNKREVKVMVTPKTAGATTSSKPAQAAKAGAEKDHAAAEEDQMQFHKGLDIAVAYGSDVKAAAAGTVIFSGQKGGYGNCIIVSHGNGLATLYGHLSELIAKTNDQVKVGDVIAKSGNSGRSTGPHLHYEVHKNNTPVNPRLFMSL